MVKIIWTANLVGALLCLKMFFGQDFYTLTNVKIAPLLSYLFLTLLIFNLRHLSLRCSNLYDDLNLAVTPLQALVISSFTS